jgi:ADP-ribose pyrophosphatase
MNKPIVPREVRRIYDGRIFTVQAETLTLPKGGEFTAEIIRHPGSVVIVPVTDAGEIVLVRQYRHAIGRMAWELPAGSLKPGEDKTAAARRECHEEIGLVADAIEPMGSFFPTPGYCDEEMNFYIARRLREWREGDAAAHADEDEDIEARPFRTEAVERMIGAGEIVDLKTVAGLFLLRRQR